MVQTAMSNRSFRDSLEALLNKQLLAENGFDPASTARENFSLFRVPVSPGKLAALTDFMDRRLASHLRLLRSPIPNDIIRKLKVNYSESLPKTMRIRTADLDAKSGKAKRVAASLGLIAALKSDQLRQFGERVTGKTLLPDPGCQVICYEPGDYSGPHTDHHPEEPELRDGYVDIHIMLSSPKVASQLLVYERRGMLNEVKEIGKGMSIAVYQLPFWHYTTPMLARPGVKDARRWLLLASYFVDRKTPRPQRRRATSS
ncbi:MAG: hypothetical protein QOI05_5136 [Bradyrhizobium sp.]|nr:hypothetical protein [Bradyrhizobium sp.]